MFRVLKAAKLFFTLGKGRAREHIKPLLFIIPTVIIIIKILIFSCLSFRDKYDKLYKKRKKKQISINNKKLFKLPLAKRFHHTVNRKY